MQNVSDVTKYTIKSLRDFNDDGSLDDAVVYEKKGQFMLAGIVAMDAPGDTPADTQAKLQKFNVSVQHGFLIIEGDIDGDGHKLADTIMIDYKNQKSVVDDRDPANPKPLQHVMVSVMTGGAQRTAEEITGDMRAVGAVSATTIKDVKDSDAEYYALVKDGETIEAIEIKYKD